MKLEVKDIQVLPIDANGFVLWFRFGWHEAPSPEAQAAFRQLEGVLEAFAAECDLIRPWHGNLVLYNMVSKEHYPLIDDELVKQCEERAKEMYPEMRVATSWMSYSNNSGVSVRMIK